MSRITYDYPGDDPPVAGDVLICYSSRTHKPTGTAYLILADRRVKTREPLVVHGVPGTRSVYNVVRVGLDDALKSPRFDSLVWHHR
jgi:hypothetical protein